MEHMTIEEVCESLQMSKQGVWKAVRERRIPHQRFSKKGRVKFLRAEIESFINNNSVSSADLIK